jgi:hypothetical protein
MIVRLSRSNLTGLVTFNPRNSSSGRNTGLTITGSRQDSVDLARNDSLNLMIHRIEGGNHEEDVYK